MTAARRGARGRRAADRGRQRRALWLGVLGHTRGRASEVSARKSRAHGGC